MRGLTLGLLTLLSSSLMANLINGPGTYPQFRSLAGLPGSGLGVTPQGKLDFSGAMSISTPVAYSLSHYEAALIGGIYNGSRSFRFEFSGTEIHGGNGTAVIMLGVPLGQYGSLTATHMVLSTKFDNAQNLHWQLPVQSDGWAFGIGVQDLAGQGGTQGESSGPRNLDPGESRTYYAVATYDFGQGHYASVGFGDTRFKGRLFANASYQIDSRLKLIAEHDTFGWNSGLAYNIGRLGKSPVPGRDIEATLTLGFLDFKNAYWTLGFSF